MQNTLAGMGILALATMGCSAQPAAHRVEEEQPAGTVQQSLCARTSLPAPPPAGASWRWGGGHGYPDIVSPTCADVVVVTGSQGVAHLRTVVSQAPPGRVVYIDGAAEFNLDGGPLVVPSDVWIASNRGQVMSGVAAPGALLTASAGVGPLIRVEGNNVRVTGLRIWGGDTDTCPAACEIGEACSSDAQCGADEHCDAGGNCERVQPCTQHSQCDSDELCDSGGHCERQQACEQDSECQNDEHCDRDERCERDQACLTKNDCGFDEYCHSSGGCRKASCAYCGPAPTAAIAAEGMTASANNLEVDNCDIGGFAYAGVEVKGAENARVHHNYIHHVQRLGLGYPVVVTGWLTDTQPRLGAAASATIEYNRFQNYRHAVASSGAPNHDYTARYNLALEKANGRVFDVHCLDEKANEGPAGGMTLVYGASFSPTTTTRSMCAAIRRKVPTSIRTAPHA
jgi:hypothetical protein